MPTPGVRPATPDDVAEIARIQRVTWQVAYADLLGEQTFEQLESPEVELGWSTAIEHPDTALHIAYEGQTLVGFCVAGPAPEQECAAADGSLPDDASSVGLIGTLLVEPRWGRRGHGGRLLAAAAASLREQAMSRGLTWVEQSDSASLGFFRKAGWNPDNTVRTLDTGERTLRELRLTGGLGLTLTDP